MSRFNLSFTGVGRELGHHEKKIVGNALKAVKRPPTLVHSGAQKGVDVLAANYALQLWPEAKHVVIIPMWQPHTRPFEDGSKPQACPHDERNVERLRDLAAELGAYLRVVEGSPGIGKVAAGYLRRDDMLAQNCTHLMAFPNTGTEQQRSGTWATVRRAVAQQRRILITPLNGEEPYKI